MSEQSPVKKRSKKIIFPLILALVLIAAVGITIREYIYYQRHEVTDDAQIDADISPVIARASGYVQEIRFTDNQWVKAGDTLAVLDDRDYKIRLQQAEAVLQSAKQAVTVSRYAVQEFKTGIATAKANVDAAKIRVWKATEDFNRYQNLYRDHAITKAQYDAAKAEKESAEAALLVAQTQVPVTHKKVSTGEQQSVAVASDISRSAAEVEYARLQLSYTAILSPADGIASKRNIQLGQLVQAGQPLLAIVNDKGIYVTANFKETQMKDLRVGEKVDIRVDAYPDSTLRGTIASFAGATGAKFSLLPPDNATGNFVKVVQRIPVRIMLDLSADLLEKLRPGMSVKVTVHTQ
ncbi:MAG: HlyD family secretion protein [Chitinophagaceae bacterium]|nr:HlyD family secretion protein [Chitinophagaceae bacterium]